MQTTPTHRTLTRDPIFPLPMEPLHLTSTEKTPAVRFEPAQGTLEISGCSIHENADRFFRPLLEQVATYCQQPMRRTMVRMSLTYFNSSSAKYFLDLLKLLDEVHASGAGSVLLEWIYDAEDLDMMEAGQDYKGLLEMPVKLIEH
jgi:SiaC family regulatory phosphoprotein